MTRHQLEARAFALETQNGRLRGGLLVLIPRRRGPLLELVRGLEAENGKLRDTLAARVGSHAATVLEALL